ASPDIRSLAIRPQREPESLYRLLLETPRVNKARIDGSFVEAEITGNEDDCCDLLASLLQRGVRVLEFKQVEADLEHVFMNITRGEVQ
ncbi:hypothetical protein SB781_32190, partial [Paraburkholderia sp. SIMBA_061]